MTVSKNIISITIIVQHTCFSSSFTSFTILLRRLKDQLDFIWSSFGIFC